MFQIAPSNWMKRRIISAKAHQEKAFEDINQLVLQSRSGKKITLDTGEELTEFVSCSYLGLDQHPKVIQAASRTVNEIGTTFPCARTRIRTKQDLELEERLHAIFNNGYCSTFTSVHLATLGLVPLLASGEIPSFPIHINGPYFILDRTVHNSVQINRGLMKQFGEVVRLPFAETDYLELEFKRAKQRKMTPIAISDGIGSMGGHANVLELLALAEKYNGYVYLDDAHGTSIQGKHGCGYVLRFLDGITHPRLIVAQALTKAFGTAGGVLVMPQKRDDDIVKRFASTYTFGGPLTVPMLDASIASADIHLSQEIYSLQNQLWANVRYLDAIFEGKLVNAELLSPVRGILVGDEFKAIDMALKLRKRGFAVTTAMYPTVDRGKSLLRIALSASHSRRDIAALAMNILRLFDENPLEVLSAIPEDCGLRKETRVYE